MLLRDQGRVDNRERNRAGGDQQVRFHKNLSMMEATPDGAASQFGLT